MSKTFRTIAKELFVGVWRCVWCGYADNPELEIRCKRCGRKDD